jgi:hypothetical protein
MKQEFFIKELESKDEDSDVPSSEPSKVNRLIHDLIRYGKNEVKFDISN